MAHDVFISYSSKDKAIADAVCAKLESQKIRCWIAPRDISAGQTWAAAIVNAIRTSRVFVLVLSEGSNKSVQVVREVGEAVDNTVPIIPFRIENVEPSDEMRYYIKSIHWLDAMSPPLERHLDKLAGSVQALITVGEQPPPTVVQPAIEAPARKPRAMPVWGIALLVVFALIIFGGIGAWVLSQQAEASLALSTPVSSEAAVETTAQGQTSSVGGEEWRTLDFVIPSETLWRQENGSFTTIAKPSQDTIAWSDEIVEGDFILSAHVTSEQPDGIAHFIVYGDGVGFSEGCLILTYGHGYVFIEKETLYGTDENFLVVIDGDYGFQEPTHDFTIEIKEGAANFYVDDKKVAFTFLPPETKRQGRIGFFADWQESVGMTYSDIKIKPLIEGDG